MTMIATAVPSGVTLRVASAEETNQVATNVSDTDAAEETSSAQEQTEASAAGEITIDETNFPDDAFREIISENIDSNKDDTRVKRYTSFYDVYLLTLASWYYLVSG